MNPSQLAALYRRVSTDHQDNSLQLQEQRVADYIKYKNFSTNAPSVWSPSPGGEGSGVRAELTYSDPDTSGRTPMLDRPGGKALMARLKFGDVKHLVVAKLDRLGRNVRDALTTIETLQKLGVTLHIADFGGDSISMQGHMGRLILTVLLAVAEWEVEEIRDRTTKTMRQLFHAGQLTGNVPYGYDCLYTLADGSTHLSNRALPLTHFPTPPLSKTLVINPNEAQVIRLMDHYRSVAGWSLKKIADQLNHLGHPSKLGKPWQCGNVDSVLQSRHTKRILSHPSDQQAAA